MSNPDWGLYDTLLTMNGETKRDRDIAKAKEDFIREAINNPSCEENAKRNGITQRFLITKDTKTLYKCNIVAFPDEDLFAGDIIEVFGERWIVYQTSVINTIQTTGILWLCNQKFKFQNFDSTIIERWGVLDSGSYTIDKTGNNQIQYIDKSINIYLSYDEDTKKIYSDKRFAGGTIFDKNGNEILEVYKVIAPNYNTINYGTGSHLLVLPCQRDKCSTNDNIELKICDYIKPPNSSSEESSTSLLPCSISGRSSIRVGTSRDYTATFYAVDGTTVVNDIMPVWSVSPEIEGVTYVSNGSLMTISVSNEDSLIGRSFIINVTDSNGLYQATTFNVEVVSFG